MCVRVCILHIRFFLLSTQKGTADTTSTMKFSATIPVALLLLPRYAGSSPAISKVSKKSKSSNTSTNTTSSCTSCDSQKIMPDGTCFSTKLYSNKYFSSDFTRNDFDNMIFSQPKQAHRDKQAHLRVLLDDVRALSGTTASDDSIMMAFGKHPEAIPLGRNWLDKAWDDVKDDVDTIVDTGEVLTGNGGAVVEHVIEPLITSTITSIADCVANPRDCDAGKKIPVNYNAKCAAAIEGVVIGIMGLVLLIFDVVAVGFGKAISKVLGQKTSIRVAQILMSATTKGAKIYGSTANDDFLVLVARAFGAIAADSHMSTQSFTKLLDDNIVDLGLDAFSIAAQIVIWFVPGADAFEVSIKAASITVGVVKLLSIVTGEFGENPKSGLIYSCEKA